MSDGSNGGGLLQHLAAAKEFIFAMVAAARPEWFTTRIVEGLVIAVVTSTLTTGAGYILVVVRLDERVLAIQKDIDGRTIANKEASKESDVRIRRVEDRLIAHETVIARELFAIREALGRLDGRTDNGRRR